ncbi:hypothetical protein EC847_101397 [Scandinavium goeteborgense]|uniref:Uncharacterized protein n=1 Tax=Scandinavium goeteborgense TaxID=1851514 RepID=A0A4V3BQX9_SCAGO|nr:hypothetical protein EC847_101397 [Scandinavium goeteborgense]
MYLWKIFFVIPVTIINIAIAGSVFRHNDTIFAGESFQYLTSRLARHLSVMRLS